MDIIREENHYMARAIGFIRDFNHKISVVIFMNINICRRVFHAQKHLL
jgi:hypothetical protein